MVVVFNATFNNISVILWRSFFIGGEHGVPEITNLPHISHKIVSSTPPHREYPMKLALYNLQSYLIKNITVIKLRLCLFQVIKIPGDQWDQRTSPSQWGLFHSIKKVPYTIFVPRQTDQIFHLLPICSYHEL